LDAAVALAPGSRRALLAAGIALLVVIVFYPILDHAWLNYDDDIYLTANPDLTKGLGPEGIVWAFTTFHGANWFPMTWLSWLLDYELFGLDPAGFHATNLVLHGVASVLLFFALVRLTGRDGRSAFVAAVFAIHPLHVEAVAWAAVRKDPLSAVFFTLALFAYARRTPRSLLIVAVCLLLGLMAKPVLLTLPFVLLLLDEWPLGRLRRSDDADRWDPPRIRQAVLEKTPLFAIVLAVGVVAVIAQERGGAVAALVHLPFSDRLLNAVHSYGVYLQQSFWPAGLAVFYPYPDATHAKGASPGTLFQIAGAAAIIVALSIAAVLNLRRRPYLAVGWFWFLGMLVPMIGLFQVGSQAHADRYTYLPLIGLSIAVAWGVADLFGQASWRKPVLRVLAVSTVAALGLTASFQVRHWQDSQTLFEHALRVTSGNQIAHAHLGSTLLDQGRPAETIAHYRKAVAADPNFLEATNNLAWLLATCDRASLRNPDDALRYAERAVALSRNEDPAVLDTLAAAQAAAGRFDEARATLERAGALAERNADDPLAAALRQRGSQYRQNRPYREPCGPR
jgi:tetratricopeptide (TPR) repeat protein